MKMEDHRALAKALNRVKGKVILSTYDCRLVRECYRGWRRAQKKFYASRQQAPGGRFQKEKGAHGG